MDLNNFPRLFDVYNCSIAPDAQVFEEMEGELTEENIVAFNKKREESLRKWHNYEPIGAVERTRISYQNGDYTGSGLVYRPTGCEGKVLPIVLYFHGGGWSTLCKECYEYECAAIAEQAECVVFNMDYRCAPEWKFPVPLEDCYAALLTVKGTAEKFGADGRRIAIAGDSAGGNLALGTAMLARRRGGPEIAYLALAYPAVGVNPGADAMVDSALLNYCGSYEAADDPLVSPIMDESPNRMPPMLIVIGTCDFLLDQNLRYVKYVADKGGDVQLALFQGMPHGFIQMTIDAGQQAIKLIAERIRNHL